MTNPNTNPLQNPLLQSGELPPFSAIQAEHVVPAIESLLSKGRSELEAQLTQPLTRWDTLLAPIEERDDELNKAWSPVCHLNAVMNSEALRGAYEKANQLVTDYYSELGQNYALYAAYETYSHLPEFATLDQARRKTVENSLRDFKLSGVALEGEAKEVFRKNASELSSLSTHFSNNVLDATRGWFIHIKDEAELAGLPEFLVSAAKQKATEAQLDGYVISLDAPVYLTVITQSANPDLREKIYRGYTTRASQEGPTAGQWDNTDLITRIMTLRQQQAELLGYANYAEVSIASKMASSVDQVLDFLTDLAQKTRPFAEKEWRELQDFAAREYGVKELNAWDVPYYSEKLKIAKYSISQEALRPYFPLPVVKRGLFALVKKLYDIDVKQAPADLWHADAEYYEIHRQGEKIAAFYFDLYARPNKRGGAWMGTCRTRRVQDGKLQYPVAYLVCNFNPPGENSPSLLTHDEVETLFHEFGHGLHHMLTKMEVAAVSGISGVEWDAVELPSQFMENFCWQPAVLAEISSHYQSGQPLPDTELRNMLAAKNFQSAMQMLRQLEFAIFDLRLHKEFASPGFPGVQALLDEVRREIAVFSPPAFNRFQNSFSHIFAGGYAAGYYSYKWAEVLSADAFAAFEEEGIFNPATGQRFMNEILEKGGSHSAMELFKKFRGREPQSDALLRHSGLVAVNG